MHRSSVRLLALPLLALLLLAPPPARAQDAQEAPQVDVAAARQAVTAYLEAVKAKKWDLAKKELHPKVLHNIADLKKRTGKEDHQLAPWAKVKESYLTNFQVGEVRPSVKGAAVVSTTEDFYSVEDKGDEPGVQAEYLVIPLGGKYLVADRRLGTEQFPDKTVPAAYKGYFEGEYEPEAAPAAEPKAGKKGKK